MKNLARLAVTTALCGLMASGTHAAGVKMHRAPAPTAADYKRLLTKVDALQASLEQMRSAMVSQSQALADAQEKLIVSQQTSPPAAPFVQTAANAPSVPVEEIDRRVQASIEKEHHNDKIYFKGLTITPGGYLELAGIYRQHFQGNDIGSSYIVPFPNNRQSHVAEGRFSARQSRLQFLAEGAVNSKIKLSMYGEFDFLGGAQTANSNESNSYNPRIRNLYATIDWARNGGGIQLLAGQSWSLITLNGKGITPRNEVTPVVPEAQYVPGFSWARQPQIRLTGDFLDKSLWVAVSVENPQTTFGGTVPATVVNNQTAGSGFDSANTLSLNHVPDVIGKVAYEKDIGTHHLHVEGFGMMRSFSARLVRGDNAAAHGYAVGGGATLQIVPKLLDVQVSGMTGKGIGRYGSVQLPDVTFAPDGSIKPIKEFMLLAGLTVHASPKLDMYGYAGEEQQSKEAYGNIGTGNPLATNNSGCFIEGGTCNGNTRRVRQLTLGFWNKLYQGSFGRAQIGLQWSYTERQIFADTSGARPEVGQNMGFLSFRYYPF